MTKEFQQLAEAANVPVKGEEGQALPAFEILEVGTAGHRTIAIVQSHVGKPRAGLRLMTMGTHKLWEVRGVAFAPVEAVKADRWGLTLVPIGHDSSLRVGEQLRAA
jgi:hypothetical protein